MSSVVNVAQLRKTAVMPEQEDLLTTAQVAERFSVTPQTIANWVAAGQLSPAFRAPGLRGAMFFTAEDVERLAKSA